MIKVRFWNTCNVAQAQARCTRLHCRGLAAVAQHSTRLCEATWEEEIDQRFHHNIAYSMQSPSRENSSIFFLLGKALSLSASDARLTLASSISRLIFKNHEVIVICGMWLRCGCYCSLPCSNIVIGINVVNRFPNYIDFWARQRTSVTAPQPHVSSITLLIVISYFLFFS